MSKFSELNDNIKIIMETVLGSQDLCKLLYYTSTNPLAEANLSDTSVLLLSSIFPTPITPGVEDEPKNIITIVLDDFALGRDNNAFKTSKIVFNVLCHLDLWLLDDTKIRPYSILNEIDTLFNQQRIATIGKLEFVSSRWIVANNKYHGYQCFYKVCDFNT
jgi:hypothetical protein